MPSLQGKVIVVAGAGSGIGRGTAMRLANDGADVVVGDLSLDAAAAVARQITAAGGSAIPAAFDMRDDASIAALIGAAVESFGGLDGVHVNAADIRASELDGDVLSLDMDIFDRTIAVNLRGHVLCTRHALPHLLARGGGALVYTTSAAAFLGDRKRVSYGISKSGLNALMRHVASRWGKEGIRSNSIAPGLVMTEATDSWPAKHLEFALNGHRSPRLGQPADIAGMVAFLMSQDGEWVNGQVLSVDGGATMR
jgi:NAD(P)-dependent dehydrogenase (short-subunit alcohol dehydrogenase family)